MAKQNNYIVCLDFETGGLDPKKNAITQIGMEILDPITLKSLASYSDYVKPYQKIEKSSGRVKKIVKQRSESEKYLYDDKALKYTNITMDLLEEKGKPIQVVMENMIDMFKKANPSNARNYKPVLLGQNLGFDTGFLQHMFDYCKQDLNKYVTTYKDFYGNLQPVFFDTQYLSRQYFASNSKVTSVKLGLVSDELGVELVSAHDAMADVFATSEIFRNYMMNMRSSIGEESVKQEKSRKHFSL